jgi:hypothetical protein
VVLQTQSDHLYKFGKMALTFSKDMQVYILKTCSMDIQRGNAARTYSMEI